ncbi:dihydroorotase [Rhizobiaceae bacterium]|nr:dihydroorotase [Rhizobiaceae bacterium]
MRCRHYIGARVIDPSSGFDGPGEVLTRGKRIVAMGTTVDAPSDAKVLDCKGLVLCPGLVDMRVFVGEPGGESRESIKTAGQAAAVGGVTTLVMMPDTDPVLDDVALVEFVRRTASKKARVNIEVMAALTRGLGGQAITEYGLLQKAGAVAFGDGRNTIASAKVMARALTYARDFGALVVAATNDDTLGNGVMNAGFDAMRLGLPGIPREAEIIPLERDMRLVAMTGGRYHAATLSTAEALDVVRAAKARALDVTAGVAVANFALGETDVGAYRTYFRVTPPLRSDEDRQAMIEGIRDGTLDVIVSNHDPQGVDDKRQPFADAADGAVGLETLLAASLRLHLSDGIPLMRVLECLTSAPADRLGLKAGRLAKGAPADLLLFDLDEPWKLAEADLVSRSKNSPFEGSLFTGRVVRTVVGGRTAYDARKDRPDG